MLQAPFLQQGLTKSTSLDQVFETEQDGKQEEEQTRSGQASYDSIDRRFPPWHMV